MKKVDKMPDPTGSAISYDAKNELGRRLFDRPIRISHLVTQNSNSPFQTNNLSKKRFEKMKIFSLSGPGVIMAEEDIVFKGNHLDRFIASSTVM